MNDQAMLDKLLFLIVDVGHVEQLSCRTELPDTKESDSDNRVKIEIILRDC